MVDRQGELNLFSLIDSLIALTLAITAVVWSNESRIPRGGVEQFLEMRVTLLNSLFAIAFTIAWKDCFRRLGLYRKSVDNPLRGVRDAIGGCGMMAALLALFLYACGVNGPIVRSSLAFFAASSFYEVTRVALTSFQFPWRRSEPERVIILGSGRRAMKAWRELRVNCHRTRHVLGFVDDCDLATASPEIAARLLGGIDELSAYFLNHAVDELVVATPIRSQYNQTQHAIAQAEAAGVRVVCLGDTYKLNFGKALRDRSALFHELLPKDEELLNAEAIKRALDIAVSACCLILLAPVFLAIAIAVKLTSRGPVFFAQERCGYKRRHFRMYKFRSMVDNAEKLLPGLERQNEAQGPIFKIRKDPRVTPLGRFLRSTSLDEIPQFWNVLIGDMSLVGPRPMSKRDVSLFNQAELMRRFSVRPGLTGMWQVSGRESFSFDQWIALDFKYIDDWSLALDLRILALTVPAVVRRVGAV